MALKYLYVPSGYKAGTAYGVLPNDSSADFDEFSRATTATRTNKDGILESMGNNVPRLDYSDGGCPSLLLEPQRTNLVIYSEQISSWGKTPSDGTLIIRTDDETSPNGNMTADVISVSTELNGVFTQGITTVAESTYSCSTYVKHVAGSSKIRVGITENFHSSTGSKYIVVDLSNGSIILNEVSSFATAKVINAGNGWYRVIIENITVPVGVGGNSHFVIYSYEDTFTEFSVWGGQIEVGNYTSSYIPNLSNGTTTRNNDAGNFAGNIDFNNSEGVFEAGFKAFPISIPSSRITLAADINNRITIGYSGGANEPRPYLLIASLSGGEDDIQISMPSSFNLFDYNTYKLKFQSGNNELKINGELVDTDNSFKTHTFSFDSALKNISLNTQGTSTERLFYGGIRHIKVYDSITDF
jgi:hypothetical protein